VASLAPPDQASPQNTLRAVIVGIAALDERARKLVTTAPEALVTNFPDASSTNEILTGWDGFLSDSDLPQPARQSLRINQRAIPINQ